jgi:maleylpyruvate isomerase
MRPITIDDVRHSSALLISVVNATADDVFQRPSLLPDWTVAHVLSHVALNAEAFVHVATALRAGRPGYMYPGGFEGRAQAIEDGARRSAGDVRAHLAAACDAFAEAWAEPVSGPGFATAVGQPLVPARAVPSRRLREVEVHGIDCGLDGLTHRDWSDAYVEFDLADQWPTVTLRTDDSINVIDDSGTRWTANAPADAATSAVRVGRRDLLAWTLDRTSVPGLPTLLPWGNRSNWKP